MVIQESDFILTNASGDLWDLELLKTVRPKGKPKRQEFQNEGYGMPLSRCIKKIINYRLESKKEVYTLKEYVRDYTKELDIIKELFKEM